MLPNNMALPTYESAHVPYGSRRAWKLWSGGAVAGAAVVGLGPKALDFTVTAFSGLVDLLSTIVLAMRSIPWS